MDLSAPISSVIPSAHGPVLAALVRAGVPLSGRQVAAMVGSQVSRSRVNSVLTELAASGLVLRASHPPSVLYLFNWEHVAAEFVAGLADLRAQLLARMRANIATWEKPATAVWMFGSGARGEGDVHSDIDILVIRADRFDENDPAWRLQLDQFSQQVTAWSGNTCEILEMSRTEVVESVRTGHKLARDLQRDALPLGGVLPSALLRQHRTAHAR